MTIEGELLGRIGSIPDPCSLATGVPVSIQEMGLIQGLEYAGGQVTVRMQITSPMCMMAAYFMREIEQRLASHADVQSVQVVFDTALNWTPEDIAPEARQRLLERRIQTIGGRMLPRPAAR
ncbi:Metal-sulfur cluster biosynthetic enzyme [Stigmatella aurantiaca]|uniref:Metal-sulfur cluster biosynthetic enzyme n=1 Tax=Stigmatella aurantiaca TaxID=41 RepID=A0A1H7HD68_STIAU|nr:iron-sulfur cluster assembly protein [Stigmatella aurantiaca]SEK48244.1 Metal-sulfur cluster biosynthetic enzyme [Stigmatella aurantiaca]